ncbi:MAG TPA: serine/threonine-protein kinase [Streptomyces sp.]|uniref:serine/threonine-protein kinase n=1 Tax=Streptomyces sp. TaxID=1931 RepID=UPI002CDDFBA8|nr:serine/threonine-protein kinase [Streptomyces sp.]HWU12188.1 serine/threonine-protein kinase [Streptomyces sp.]
MRLLDFAQATASRCSAEVLNGRYRLDEFLGSGGAADVHRGFDLRLRRPVAVKVFRPDAGIDIDIEESLHSEAVILARLHHPGLVTAYDAGQHDGRAFLVMQLIEGSTLKNRITQGPLSPEATAALGAGLAHALAHAHEAGVVHRDVKPSNILLDAAHHPHLADFGISRLLDATTHTATGTLIGTAAYLSPEQVLGRPVGRPSDIYALGLVLLECLTGRLEYDGGPLEAAIARLHRPPVLPHGLPDRLSILLRDMTALDEQDRPTARDCARTLAATAGEALGTPGPSAHVTSLVAGQEPSRTAEDTHTNPMLGGKPPAARTTSARGRTLMAGATVALAAVTTTVLTVTGSSAPQDNGRDTTRATGAPAVEPERSAGSGQKTARAPSAAPSSGPGTSVGAVPEDAGAYSSAPEAAHTAPRDPATSAAAATPPATTPATTPTTTQGGTTAAPRPLPPGQAKKTEKAEKTEKDQQQKKPGRTAPRH